VIVNIVRGGPGLGSIQPAQSDYYQATRGGGHGDYRMCALAPSSVQEAVTLTQDAFDIADRYRNPVMIMGDGLIGQMMEPVDMDVVENRTPAADLKEKTWAATGHKATEERPRAVINSLYIDPALLEQQNLRLQAKYDAITANECRWQEESLDDAEIVLVAYGTTSRIAQSAMRKCRVKGIKVGMLRPITIWPFPTAALQRTLKTANRYLCVEMSMGQMVDDVRLAIGNQCPVDFYGRAGGMVPTVEELVAQIEALAGVSRSIAGAANPTASHEANAAWTADPTTREEGNAEEAFGKKIDSIAAQVGQAAGAIGAKLNGLGKKLDEKLESAELADKAEQLKDKAVSAAGKAKSGFLKGVNNLRGAIGNALQTARNDLAEIEAQQKAEWEAEACAGDEIAGNAQCCESGDGSAGGGGYCECGEASETAAGAASLNERDEVSTAVDQAADVATGAEGINERGEASEADKRDEVPDAQEGGDTNGNRV